MAGVTVPLERIDAGAPNAAASHAILVVDDIVKRFETPDGVLTAVDHVSLSVAPGEFVGIIGPSGCGKSTLFNVIGGLLDGYEGTVKVAGERVRGPHRIDRHDLPGGVRLFPGATCIDNVAFPLEIAGLPKAERYERAGISSGWSASTGSSGATRRSCRAACASACRWRARWRRNRKSC